MWNLAQASRRTAEVRVRPRPRSHKPRPGVTRITWIKPASDRSGRVLCSKPTLRPGPPNACATCPPPSPASRSSSQARKGSIAPRRSRACSNAPPSARAPQLKDYLPSIRLPRSHASYPQAPASVLRPPAYSSPACPRPALQLPPSSATLPSELKCLVVPSSAKQSDHMHILRVALHDVEQGDFCKLLRSPLHDEFVTWPTS